MTDERKCVRCGSADVVPGNVQSSGKLAFGVKHPKFMTTKTANVSISGVMCVECGHVELIGDCTKAKLLVES